MKAPPAWAGRAVKPRSRKTVREAQGLTARTSAKPSFRSRNATRADAVRLIKSRILHFKSLVASFLGVIACNDPRGRLVNAALTRGLAAALLRPGRRAQGRPRPATRPRRPGRAPRGRRRLVRPAPVAGLAPSRPAGPRRRARPARPRRRPGRPRAARGHRQPALP